MKPKVIFKIFLTLFINVFLIFSYNFSKIILEKRRTEKQKIVSSLNNAGNKIDLSFKYSTWIETKSIDFNEIFENYVFYKKSLNLNNSTYIYKIPYKEKSFNEIGKNALILLKNPYNKKNKIEKLITGKIKTIPEIENYLLENSIKNFKIIYKNALNFKGLFSDYEIQAIVNDYFKESFKYPIIRNNDMIFYKKENNKFFMMKIQNYKYIFQTLLQTKSSKIYEYFFIITPSTRYLYHPKKELLDMDIFLESKLDEDDALEKKAIELYNEKFYEDYSILKNNKVTTQTSIMGYKKLSEVPLYLGIISIKEDAMLDSNLKLKDLFDKTILAFSFISFFYVLSEIKTMTKIKIFLLSFLQFIILCTYISSLSFYSTKKELNKFTAIYNEKDIWNYLRDNNQSKDFKIKLEIDSIEHIGANNIKLTGIIEYKNEPQNNFFFPDAVQYEEKVITVNKNIIIKQFFVTIREKFEYSKYPLDSNIIWLKIRNRTNTNKIIIPDFEKYNSTMVISSNTGIKKDIALNGWDIVGTFFSFNKYSSDKHELLYNICLKRKILNPFISTLLPISIILFIIFGILTLIEKDKSDSRIEFILGSISGLFFTIIISQNSLREQINTNELLYLDYYYFLLYIILAIIILISFLYKYKKISYENIYILKKLFWFIIFFIIFIITFLQFYD